MTADSRTEVPADDETAEDPSEMPYDTDQTEYFFDLDPTGSGIDVDPTWSSAPDPTQTTYSPDPTAASEVPDSSETPTVQPTAPPVVLEFIPGYRVKVKVASARIRAGASLNSDVIDGAVQGEILDVTGVDLDFYIIEKNGRKAYIHESVVDYGPYEKPVPPPTVAPTAPPPTNPPAPPETKAEYRPGNGTIICLDAGHKPGGGISATEPNWPGSATMKAKLTTGAGGTVDGVYYPEYLINGQVADLLKAELEARGYTVILVDRNLSNAERAEVANASGASAFIRIHCNSLDNPSVRGLMTYVPTASNPSPYMSDALIQACTQLSAALESRIMAAAAALNDPGYVFRGRLSGNTMTGINWCKIPVVIVEMAFMSNPDDMRLLASPAFQAVMARGMADGIDAFLGK